jgi:predicted nucleotidyltransferase component of viral defense system
LTEEEKARLAASVRDRLLNLAKTRQEAFDLVLTRYALERFLYRLSVSLYKDELVLKGAMLFQLWSNTPHRATRDLDLLARGDTGLDSLSEKIRSICSTSVPEDGLRFDTSSLSVQEIREETEYSGVRARFLAYLGSARINLQVDFGVGDAVTPAAQKTVYPTLLGMEPPVLLAYPRETVVAEKLEAIVSLGMDNSRMKDYFDLWTIATIYADAPEGLAEAVRNTFDRRQRPLPEGVPVGLSDEFAADAKKQGQWKAFLRRTVGGSLTLEEVVPTVREFAVPLFQRARHGTGAAPEAEAP